MKFNAKLINAETKVAHHTTQDPKESIEACKKWAHLQGSSGFDFMWDLGNTHSVWVSHSTGQRFQLVITKA